DLVGERRTVRDLALRLPELLDLIEAEWLQHHLCLHHLAADVDRRQYWRLMEQPQDFADQAQVALAGTDPILVDGERRDDAVDSDPECLIGQLVRAKAS